MILFFLKVWEWLKKYWKWILFPIGILGMVITYFIGRSSKKTKVEVISPVEKEADDMVKKEQAEADKKAAEAKKERDEKVAQLEKEHAETIKEFNDELRDKYEEIKDDPDKVSEFLLNVGKSMRESG